MKQSEWEKWIKPMKRTCFSNYSQLKRLNSVIGKMHFVELLIGNNPLCATPLLTSSAKSYVLLEKLLDELGLNSIISDLVDVNVARVIFSNQKCDQVIHARTLVDVDFSRVEEVQDPEVVACGVDLAKRWIPLRFLSLLSLPSHDNFISIQLANR
ncbi:hypothetical protein ACTXT7_013212 [Hymenolepis weldensis]